jgi:hypothetical protein
MLPTHDLKLKSGDELGEFKWSEYQPMKLEDAHHRISIGKLVSESKLAAPQRVQSDTALAKDRHDRGDKCTCVVHRRPGGVNRIAECNTVAASEQQQHDVQRGKMESCSNKYIEHDLLKPKTRAPHSPS